jgi:tetratricopeptide (TPR) repeat protein
LKKTEKQHGQLSRNTLKASLMLAAMYCVAEDYEKAEPLLKRCIATAKNNLLQHANALFWASALLAESYFAMNRIAEAMTVCSQAKPLSRAVDSSAPDPVFEALWHLALSFEAGRKSESREQGLVVALMALCWFVTRGLNGSRADAHAQEDLRLHFSSYGIVLDEWNWLVKHAHLAKCDFVGLLSIVLQNADLSPVSAGSWMDRKPRVHVIR